MIKCHTSWRLLANCCKLEDRLQGFGATNTSWCIDRNELLMDFDYDDIGFFLCYEITDNLGFIYCITELRLPKRIPVTLRNVNKIWKQEDDFLKDISYLKQV